MWGTPCSYKKMENVVMFKKALVRGFHVRCDGKVNSPVLQGVLEPDTFQNALFVLWSNSHTLSWAQSGSSKSLLIKWTLNT